MFSTIVFVGLLVVYTASIKEDAGVYAAPVVKEYSDVQTTTPAAEEHSGVLTTAPRYENTNVQATALVQEDTGPHPVTSQVQQNTNGANTSPSSIHESNLFAPTTPESIADQIKAIEGFFSISEAFGGLLPSVRDEINDFLLAIIPRMPRENVVTQHFVNGLTALQLYEAVQRLHLSPQEQREFTHHPLAVYAAHILELNKAMGQPESFLSRITPVPPFPLISSAFGELPPQLREEIRIFLDRIIPQMPDDNAITEHFSSGREALESFEQTVERKMSGEDPAAVRVEAAARKLKQAMGEVGNFVLSADRKLRVTRTQGEGEKEHNDEAPANNGEKREVAFDAA